MAFREIGHNKEFCRNYTSSEVSTALDSQSTVGYLTSTIQVVELIVSSQVILFFFFFLKNITHFKLFNPKHIFPFFHPFHFRGKLLRKIKLTIRSQYQCQLI